MTLHLRTARLLWLSPYLCNYLWSLCLCDIWGPWHADIQKKKDFCVWEMYMPAKMPLLECSCMHAQKCLCTRENHCLLHALVMRCATCEGHTAAGRQALALDKSGLSLLARILSAVETESWSQLKGGILAHLTEHSCQGPLDPGARWQYEDLAFSPPPRLFCFPVWLPSTGSPLVRASTHGQSVDCQSSRFASTRKKKAYLF